MFGSDRKAKAAKRRFTVRKSWGPVGSSSKTTGAKMLQATLVISKV